MSRRPQLLLALGRFRSLAQSVRHLSCLENVGFPVVHAPGAAPNVIYCHGLGGAYNLPFPIKIQEYVSEHKGHGFTRFQYRNVQDVSRVWHVNEWLEDLVNLLDRIYADVGAQVIMASSAAAHAALRAAFGIFPFLLIGVMRSYYKCIGMHGWVGWRKHAKIIKFLLR